MDGPNESHATTDRPRSRLTSPSMPKARPLRAPPAGVPTRLITDPARTDNREQPMGERTSKNALYAEFAAVGKTLGNPKRLELLDLLAQGPRSVEDLATSADLGMSTCSAHLHSLREAGLATARRDGKRVFTPSPATTSPPCGTTCAVSPSSTARTPNQHAAPTWDPKTPRPSTPTSCCVASRSETSSSSTCAPSRVRRQPPPRRRPHPTRPAR